MRNVEISYKINSNNLINGKKNKHIFFFQDSYTEKRFPSQNLHFTGATRWFKHNLLSTSDDILKILKNKFKNKTVLGSLPSNLIDELKEVSKDKIELASNIKKVYKAFADGVKADRYFDEKVNEVFSKMGLKKNNIKVFKTFRDGAAAIVYGFKMGERAYVLKHFYNPSGHQEKRAGNVFEQTIALFANKNKLNASSFLSLEDNVISFFKYNKILWGDVKNRYMVSSYLPEVEIKTEKIFNTKTGKLNLNVPSEISLGLKCEDLSIDNIRGNIVIDHGFILLNNLWTKKERAENKQIVKSIFKTSTPDEFWQNLIQNQDKLFNNFFQNRAAQIYLVTAYNNCSPQVKNLVHELANDRLKLSILELANHITKSDEEKLDLARSITKRCSDFIKVETIKKLLIKVYPESRIKLFEIMMPHASDEVKNRLLKEISLLPEDKIDENFELIMKNASEEFKIEFTDNLSSYPFKNRLFALKLLNKDASEELKKVIKKNLWTLTNDDKKEFMSSVKISKGK